MGLLKFIFVMTVQLRMCSGRNDTQCTDIGPCNCSISSLKIVVNCRESGVNISDICGICNKVKQVQSLDIGKNGLTNIPSSCFEKCTDLDELFMDSNSLGHITRSAFKGLEHLKRLNLNKNGLIRASKIHDPNLFQSLEGLKELYIQQNVNKTTETGNITYLSNLDNGTLRNVVTIALDGLPYGCFGENFRSFRRLKEVIFSDSQIYSLTNDSFKNIPHIRKLDLSNCSLINIEADTFEPLKEMAQLNLSYNMALGFPTFRNVTYGLRNSRSLDILDYSKVYKTFGLSTQINRCDIWYLQNTSLKEIHLNSNRMASIELDALHLLPSTLQTIYLEDNKLTFGPFALQMGCVTNMSRLELNQQDYAHPITTFNNERDIVENKKDSSGSCPVKESSLSPMCRLNTHKPFKPIDFRVPSTLKIISFSNSNLRYEPSTHEIAYPLRNKIESLDLSNNIFFQWTDKFLKVTALKHLNLSNNFCTNISGDFFKNFVNLETLDASNNKIGPVLGNDRDGSTFENVNRLRILNLSRNWIENLSPNLFIHLASLELLDLSYNLMENLDFHYSHMENLSILNLQQNKISSVPKGLLEHMDTSALKTHKNVSIDLSDNILDAEDCENLDFLEWLIEHKNIFYNINNYTFVRAGHAKMSFEELKMTINKIKKGCQNYTGIIILSTSFIMSMATVIIGGMLYRYRWRLRYFYYMTKARYNGYVPVKQSDADATYQYDVFISYSTDNYQFVTGELYKKLKGTGLSMCLHQKDFLPGTDIAENIVHAVRNSKLTLIVLSPAFLKSKWCIYEFNMARMESIYSRDGENTIFVLMYEPVDLTEVSPEMKECLESESYLPYPQDDEEKPYFWQMLKQVLSAPNNVPIN